MELSNSNIKRLLIFSQKKAFLIFQKTKTLKKLFLFQEIELSLFQEMETLKNFLYFKKQFLELKNKKLFILFLIKKQNFLSKIPFYNYNKAFFLIL